MLSQIRPAIVLLALFTLLTGLAYPLAITGIAQIILPHQANGSLLTDAAGHPVGSALIGQNFTAAKYFHNRPSATQAQDPAHPDDSSKTIDAPYNAANSTGSNLGPTSKKLLDRVKADVAARRAAGWAGPIPADCRDDFRLRARPGYFAGGRAGAGRHGRQGAQSARGEGARARRAHVAGRTFGLVGEPRVNVLRLNMALDALKAS